MGVGVGAEFGNTVVAGAGVIGYEFGFAPGLKKALGGGGGGLGGSGGLGGEKGRTIAPVWYCGAGAEFGFEFGIVFKTLIKGSLVSGSCKEISFLCF